MLEKYTPNETHGEETCMSFSSLDSAGTLPIKNSEGGPQMGPPPAESLTPLSGITYDTGPTAG